MSRSRVAFTLLEVLIFCAIISTFFVSAAAITTFLLRSMKANEHRIIAARYAEELLEWIRAEKERDWEALVSSECFNQSPIVGVTACSPTLKLGEAPNKIFNRELVQTNSVSVETDVVQKTFKVIVEWPEGSDVNLQSVQIETILGIWER